MSDADIEWLQDARDVLRYALYVRYSCCSRRSCVVASFGISSSSSRSVSVRLDEVFVVVVLRKNTARYLFSSDKLSIVLYTSCARRVRVPIVVALCDVGL